MEGKRNSDWIIDIALVASLGSIVLWCVIFSSVWS